MITLGRDGVMGNVTEVDLVNSLNDEIAKLKEKDAQRKAEITELQAHVED